MRKEDRIRQQKSQNPMDPESKRPEPRPAEQGKGSTPSDRPERPPRRPGEKLPIPD